MAVENTRLATAEVIRAAEAHRTKAGITKIQTPAIITAGTNSNRTRLPPYACETPSRSFTDLAGICINDTCWMRFRL